jgi:hypothetical protein
MEQNQLESAKIAMEEYKVLHAELLVRYSSVIQILMGAAAAIVAIIGFGANGNLKLSVMAGLVVLVLALVGFAWSWIDWDVRKASRRIIEIEGYVNRTVGGDQENPLSWERRFGLHSVSYADRILRRK